MEQTVAAMNTEAPIIPDTRTVLHVGCGGYRPGKLHHAFQEGTWQEVRLDIDPGVAPDIVASITDMRAVASNSVDAVFSAHNLEHLYAHEVPIALGEFLRVLKPDGIVLITLPDLQEVAKLVAGGMLQEPAYISLLGPIAPLDILFGLRSAVAQGNTFMAHRTGFTGRTLSAYLLQAGFAATVVQRNPAAFDLWAIGFRSAQTEKEMEDAKYRFLPLHAALRQ